MPDSDRDLNTPFNDIRKTVSELLETGRELQQDLLHTIRTRTEDTDFGTSTPLSHAMASKYEAWYSLSIRLISFVLAERKGDFRNLYKSGDAKNDIYDYLILGETDSPDQVASRLQNQIALLRAAQIALDSVLMDLRGTLQAEPVRFRTRRGAVAAQERLSAGWWRNGRSGPGTPSEVRM